MTEETRQTITPMKTDYSQWYLDVIFAAKLADYAPVRGCMVIRPNGYAIWERIQQILDGMFKETGHQNAYFPLLIPESFLKKEAEHVEGFAPECAIVTHGGGKKLEENLMIRPTSETVIWSMYKNWIMSYRDLPLLINQWCNVLRWEMRTRPFLRTTEFLWQEGHTAHATESEAESEARRMLSIYRCFAEDFMALPVIDGIKTEGEKFAGALKTYTIEAMMQDKKALQLGTSHNLGQNFSKAFDVKFQNEQGNMEHVWATSWGVSTRLIGALIMAHSDNKGLVLPPKLAPTEMVIVPIYKKGTEKEKVLNKCNTLSTQLKKRFSITFDDRDTRSPGWKFNEWEQMGVPLRIELGPRDVEKGQVVIARRDTGEKTPITENNLEESLAHTLSHIQSSLFDKAQKFLENNTHNIEDYHTFKALLESESGFFSCHFCESNVCEERIKEEAKATVRCIPFRETEDTGTCFICGNDSRKRVIVARSY